MSRSVSALAWRSRSLVSSRRSPETSRIRMTARPPTARPSASRCRPPRLASASRKPSPRPRRRSTWLSRIWAISGASHEPKPRMRRGIGASMTSDRSPSMSGSPLAEPHATMICGSADRNTLARSSAARAFVRSETNAISRCVQRLRPVRCSSAVEVENSTSATNTETPTTPWVSLMRTRENSGKSAAAAHESPAAAEASAVEAIRPNLRRTQRFGRNRLVLSSTKHRSVMLASNPRPASERMPRRAAPANQPNVASGLVLENPLNKMKTPPREARRRKQEQAENAPVSSGNGPA